MTVALVYVNTADRAEALRIGRAMVEARLAAAANVIPGVSSIYRWQGEVHEAAEAMLVLKTAAEQTGRLVEAVKAMHGYDCPGILAVTADGGNPDYLAWVERETGGVP